MASICIIINRARCGWNFQSSFAQKAL